MKCSTVVWRGGNILFVALLVSLCSYHDNGLQSFWGWRAVGVEAATTPLRIIFTGSIEGNYDKRKSDFGRRYGGLPYLASEINSQKQDATGKSIPTLTVDCGQHRSVGLLDTIDLGQVAIEYFHHLKYDVIGIGQDDFLAGVSNLLEGLKLAPSGLQTKMVASNLKFGALLANEFWSLMSQFVVLTAVVPGSAAGSSPSVKVGVVSFVDPNLCQITACEVNGTSILEPQPIVTSINNNVATMKAQNPDIDIVVCLLTGFLGEHVVDQELVVQLNVDVLLYTYEFQGTETGNSPFYGIQDQPHPVQLSRPENKGILIVGGAPYSGTIGVLDLQVDKATKQATLDLTTPGSRNLISPVLQCAAAANSGVTLEVGCTQPDATVEAIVVNRESKMNAVISEVIGYNNKFMHGNPEVCRFTECRTGSLVTKALYDYAIFAGKPCDIAITNGGSIRANLSEGNLTLSDLYKAFPFNDVIKRSNITGKDLLALMENGLSKVVRNKSSESISQAFDNGGTGRFLHYSGAHVYYNSNDDPGSRVHSVFVESQTIKGPLGYRKIDTQVYYTICASSFLTGGGDEFTFGSANVPDLIQYDKTLQEVLRWYMVRHANLSISVPPPYANPLQLPADCNCPLPRVTDVDETLLCPSGCYHGVCLSNSTCSCSSFAWGGSSCNTFLPADQRSCSEKYRLAESYLWHFDFAIDEYEEGSISMLLFQMTALVTWIIVTTYIWRVDLSFWSLTSRFPQIEQDDPDFWDGFTVYELKRQDQNYLRFVALAFEGIQFATVPLVARTEWDWNSGFNILIEFASGTIEEVWFYWVIVFLTILYIVYSIILYFELDAVIEKTTVGKFFIAPCTTFLLIYSSAGYIPALTLLSTAMNCHYISELKYNTTYIDLVDSTLTSVGSVPDGGISFQYEDLYVPQLDCMICFTTKHWVMLVVSFTLLIVYIPLSSYTCYMWQEFSDCQTLQLRFNPKYILMLTAVKTTMVIGRVFFAVVPALYLSILILIFSFCSYICVFGKPCIFLPANYWGAVGFVVGVINSIALLVLIIMEDSFDGDGFIPTLIIASVFLISLIALITICSFKAPLVLESSIGARSGKDILKSMMYATKHRRSEIRALATTPNDSNCEISHTFGDAGWFYKMFANYSGGNEKEGSSPLSSNHCQRTGFKANVMTDRMSGDSGVRRGSVTIRASFMGHEVKKNSIASLDESSAFGSNQLGKIAAHRSSVRNRNQRSSAKDGGTELLMSVRERMAWKEIILALDECLVSVEKKDEILSKIAEHNHRTYNETGDMVDYKALEEDTVLLEFYIRLRTFLKALKSKKPIMLLSHYFMSELELNGGGINHIEGDSLRKIRHSYRAAILNMCESVVVSQMDINVINSETIQGEVLRKNTLVINGGNARAITSSKEPHMPPYVEVEGKVNTQESSASIASKKLSVGISEGRSKSSVDLSDILNMMKHKDTRISQMINSNEVGEGDEKERGGQIDSKLCVSISGEKVQTTNPVSVFSAGDSRDGSGEARYQQSSVPEEVVEELEAEEMVEDILDLGVPEEEAS
eukprot:Nk52_evm4s214 gene=Nk52_evmTU4s214